MNNDITGHVALVTGSARRVGRAIAISLAQSGVNVVIHFSDSASHELAHSTASYITREYGVQTLVVRGDLRKPEDIDSIFEEIDNRFGQFDILVNSAASFAAQELDKMTLSDWESVIQLNLTAPMLCSQAALNMMDIYAPAHGGSIINILDTTAIRGRKTMPAHSVAKAGLKMLTDVFALFAAPSVRVNSIVLGPVLQDSSMDDTKWYKLGKSLPLQRTGTPEDAGEAVIFLCQNSWITGTTLVVDGGALLK